MAKGGLVMSVKYYSWHIWQKKRASGKWSKTHVITDEENMITLCGRQALKPAQAFDYYWGETGDVCAHCWRMMDPEKRPKKNLQIPRADVLRLVTAASNLILAMGKIRVEDWRVFVRLNPEYKKIAPPTNELKDLLLKVKRGNHD